MRERREQVCQVCILPPCFAHDVYTYRLRQSESGDPSGASMSRWQGAIRPCTAVETECRCCRLDPQGRAESEVSVKIVLRLLHMTAIYRRAPICLRHPVSQIIVFEHGHPAWDRHACKFVDAEDGSNRGTKRSVRRQVRRRQVFQVSCGATGDALQKLVALQKDRAARRSRKDNSRKTVASSRTGRAPAVAG